MSTLAGLAHATRQLLPGPRSQTRVAHLIGGSTAAVVGKITYDYLNKNNGSKQVRASESSDREAILNQFYADEVARIKKENEPVQCLLDAIFKANCNQTLSETECAQIIDAIPLLVREDDKHTPYKLAYQKFFWGEQFETLHQHFENNSTLLQSDFCIVRPALLKSLVATIHACNDSTNKKLLDKIVGKLLSMNTNDRARWLTYGIFKNFPDLRLRILEQITDLYDVNTSYEHACSVVNSIVYCEISPLMNHSETMPCLLYMLQFLAQQNIGTGALVTYLLHEEPPTLRTDKQMLSWLLTKQLMQHPELTPALAATYNNPAPEFNGFRDFINQTHYSYCKGSPEDDALYAIKREAMQQAKAAATSGCV
jgi:predicted transcriptional regulator